MSPLRSFGMCCVSALCLVSANSEAQKSNPLEKTISFLEGLQKSIVADGEKEGDAYRKYFDWCTEAAMTATQQIKEGTRTSANLNAEIQEASSDFEDSVSHIEELATRISENDGQLKEARDVREKEMADFKASEAQLMEAMQMLGRAIDILDKNAKEQNKEAPGASLVQKPNAGIPLEVIQTLAVVVEAAGVDSESKDKLAAMLQQGSGQEGDDVGAPDGDDAYQAHSADIVELMTNMRTKASDQLRESRAGETKAQHNFELVEQSLVDQTENAKEDLGKEKGDKNDAAQRKATAEGDLNTATSQLTQAKDTKKKIQATCMQTAADHEASLKNRAQELATLKEAHEVITKTTGEAADKTYSFVQVSHTHTQGISERLAGKEVVSIVKRLAAKQHSARLAQLASRMSAIIKYGSSDGAADPFDKVKGLIKDMISKLQKEATADVKEKEYCDSEMKKTKLRKADLQDEVKDLKVKIDKASSDSTTFKRDAHDLQREMADEAAEQAHMDESRQAMHEAYLVTKADLQKGLNGLHTAMRVLKDYYGADDASFVQTSDSSESDDEQPIVDNHEKSETTGQSIIGLLETIESDFAKNLARVETEEDSQQSEFDRLTQANKVSKVSKERDVEYKTKGYKGLDKSVAQLTSDMTTSNEELTAVKEYWSKVKERCLGKPEKFAERKARRKAEIKGLREAKAMLEGSNIPVSMLARQSSYLRKKH